MTGTPSSAGAATLPHASTPGMRSDTKRCPSNERGRDRRKGWAGAVQDSCGSGAISNPYLKDIPRIWEKPKIELAKTARLGFYRRHDPPRLLDPCIAQRIDRAGSGWVCRTSLGAAGERGGGGVGEA